MAASAVGTALATVFGGLAAYLDAWRLAFAAPALAGVVLAVMLTRLPEPRDFAARGEGGTARPDSGGFSAGPGPSR